MNARALALLCVVLGFALALAARLLPHPLAWAWAGVVVGVAGAALFARDLRLRRRAVRR